MPAATTASFQLFLGLHLWPLQRLDDLSYLCRRDFVLADGNIQIVTAGTVQAVTQSIQRKLAFAETAQLALDDQTAVFGMLLQILLIEPVAHFGARA